MKFIPMKDLLIIITPLLLFLIGCSAQKNTISNGNIQLINATVDRWSDPPPPNSDIPERGADLSITVEGWSNDYTPQYIIYNQRRTLSISVSDTVDNHSVISGRIVRSSSKLTNTSQTISESDRLVYRNEDDKLKYIEITEWE